jgi:hypothetical protein
MKPVQDLTKDTFINQTIPTTYIDINAVAVEAEVPCRTASSLEFIGPNGVFTKVDKSATTISILGQITEVIKIDLTLNQSNRIKPGSDVPNCNRDGVLYLAAKSINVRSVADPIYVRDAGNVVTNVVVYFIPANRLQSATIGLRVKFEEGVGTTAQFNPKKKSGTVTYP